MTALLSLKTKATQKTFRSGFEAYKLYSAVSLHITTKFDAVKYNFKKATPAKWNENSFPEKHIFDRIARHHKTDDWVLLYGRNCIHTTWVRDFAGDIGDTRLNITKGFLENPQKQFEAMFNSYLISLHNKRIKYSDSLRGQTPFILHEFEAGRLTAEFIILIDAFTPFLMDCDSLIYKDLAFRLHKYSQLFCIDLALLKNVIKSACS